jgi:hypothetical protein
MNFYQTDNSNRPPNHPRFLMNDVRPDSSVPPGKITTLVDHQREGRFVFAFCPLCDHAEEAEDLGGGRDQAASASAAKIEKHLRKYHRGKSFKLKISINPQGQVSIPANHPGQSNDQAPHHQH